MKAIPNWAKKLDWYLIQRKALKYGLDQDLVAAVIQVESAGNPFAIRYERNYRWTFNVNMLAQDISCTPDTMEQMQKTSYGLMQVMGGVAYEHGLAREKDYDYRWPTSLIMPEMGVEYGCRHLKAKQRVIGDDPARIYAAYNAGSAIKTDGGLYINQRAVDRFYAFYLELRDADNKATDVP